MFDTFLNFYEKILHYFAEFTIHTLEMVGISIIIFGSIRALMRVIKKLRRPDYESQNVMIELGRALALALEFKMGAEIVKTVIIRDLQELVILGVIIGLRAVLAVLIHWEITNEKKESEAQKNAKNPTDTTNTTTTDTADKKD